LSCHLNFDKNSKVALCLKHADHNSYRLLKPRGIAAVKAGARGGGDHPVQEPDGFIKQVSDLTARIENPISIWFSHDVWVGV
jgi:hypothetical protein